MSEHRLHWTTDEPPSGPIIFWRGTMGMSADQRWERKYVPAEQLRGAVEAIRTLRAYLAKPEGDGPIRYIEALALCDSILLGLPDEGGRR